MTAIEGERAEGREGEPASGRAGAPKRGRWPGRAVRVLVGLSLGLAAAEGLFWFRDRGAFPHVNLYEPDAELGLRLRPGASQRLVLGANPVTKVRVNREGHRGADWPPPSPGETIVVGDSQVFGLGVEEHETFSAALGRKLGASVLNAGVPTYGPPEFLRVVERSLAARQIGTVVYVVNLANDLFEAERPNTARHVNWDGWAVRRERAPASVVAYPGRALLMRESHAVYALRRWLYGGAAAAVDPGLPSEGGWRDLVGAGEALASEQVRAERETARLTVARANEIKARADDVAKAQERVDKLIGRHVDQGLQSKDEIDDIDNKTLMTYRAGRADPGDIVGEARSIEEGRSVVATAAMIREGARLRAAYERRLRELAAKNPKVGAEAAPALDERDRGLEELEQRQTAPREIVRAASPMAKQLAAVKAACDARGARLLVVALPLDVQVSPEEWRKYGQAPIDMAEARVLVDDVVGSARSAGALALDASAALAAAEPGAFLAGDLHMTPKGHEALAGAVAEALTRPPPPPLAAPRGGLPPGRSRVPIVDEWSYKEHSPYDLSDIEPPNIWEGGHCSVHKRREWFRVSCVNHKGAPPVADAVVVEGGGGEAYSPMLDPEGWSSKKGPDLVSIVAPLAPGERLVADVRWATYEKRVTLDWSNAEDLEPSLHVGPERRLETPVRRSEREATYCACRKKVQLSDQEKCDLRQIADDPDCLRTYADDCAGLLSCLAGSASHPPRCAPGYANAGARERCLKLCGEGAPCESGVCTAWQGGNVCMGGAPP